MKLKSEAVSRRSFKHRDVDADLVIVGGGMAGTCCAITVNSLARFWPFALPLTSTTRRSGFLSHSDLSILRMNADTEYLIQRCP